MIQRDFILRMIEMLGLLIRGILGLIKKGDFQKATEALEIAYEDFLKHDASFFQQIPVNDLTHLLLSEHHFTHGHLEILGELFFAQAELYIAQGKQTESLEYYRKSFLLLSFVEKESKTYAEDKQNKLVLIQSQIDKLKD